MQSYNVWKPGPLTGPSGQSAFHSRRNDERTWGAAAPPGQGTGGRVTREGAAPPPQSEATSTVRPRRGRHQEDQEATRVGRCRAPIERRRNGQGASRWGPLCGHRAKPLTPSLVSLRSCAGSLCRLGLAMALTCGFPLALLFAVALATLGTVADSELLRRGGSSLPRSGVIPPPLRRHPSLRRLACLPCQANGCTPR